MKQVIKIGISGSRSITDREFVFKTLDFYLKRLLEEFEVVLVHGGAVGIDSLAEEWSILNGIETIIFKPDYNLFPPKVAPIKRNQDIVNESQYLLAITTGSSGTASTIKMAEKKGIPTKIIKYEQ